jgi:hypothetical protein
MILMIKMNIDNRPVITEYEELTYLLNNPKKL